MDFLKKLFSTPEPTPQTVVKKTAAQIAAEEDQQHINELTQKMTDLGAQPLTAESDWDPDIRNEIALKVSINGVPIKEDPDILAAATKNGRNDTKERKTTVEEEIGLLRQELNEEERQKRFKSS